MDKVHIRRNTMINYHVIWEEDGTNIKDFETKADADKHLCGLFSKSVKIISVIKGIRVDVALRLEEK